jgi:hypothetical protein
MCYKYKKIIFNNPIFENTVDATYIIHLKGNGRLKNIINQLSIYHPTKIVYILFNKGYKKCNKLSFITNPPLDLVDCNINIFNHAKSLKYNNILVLEDDFIFSKNILDKQHINNINSFIIDNILNTEFCYLLGCLPLFAIPNFSDLNTYQYLISGGMHSVIYSKKYRNKILNLNQKDIHDWDLYSWKFIKNRYCYYKPLCYQLFSETENFNYWGFNTLLRYIMQYILILTRYLFIFLKMDQQPEPGFSYFYIFGKISPIILYIILYFIKNYVTSLPFIVNCPVVLST